MKNNNLWAPWRIEYLKSLEETDRNSPTSHPQKCFLCKYWQEPENDKENLLLWRGQLAMVVMNRFPYSAGHLLIAPVAHVPELDNLDKDTMLEIFLLAGNAQQALTKVIRPHGFNIGINIGRCAGAGLPEHIHMHLVPRWDGDTNFMTVNAQTRVISQSLDELYIQLKKTVDE